MRFLRILVPILLVIAVMGLVLRGLFMLNPEIPWLAANRVTTVRALAVGFLLSDIAISAALVLLLIMRDRRAPAALETRLPARGRWLWPFLVGVAVLSYAALAPTFLYLLIRSMEVPR